ncbi:MAG: hypothetical protein GY757_30015, partial [bacterium]|nr:hypothetical protein [bacterium]
MRNKIHLEKLIIAANQQPREKKYWLDRLAGPIEKTAFEYDYNKLRPAKAPTASIYFKLKQETYTQLIRLSRQSDDALHMILMAGVSALLHIYSGSKDIILETPVYNEGENPDSINTVLTIRNNIAGTMTFKELLMQVRERITEADENANYPVEVLLEQLNHTSTSTDFPLSDIGVLLDNIHRKQDLKHLKLNVILSFTRRDDSMEGEVEYGSHLYDARTIERLLTHLERLLNTVLTGLD